MKPRFLSFAVFLVLTGLLVQLGNARPDPKTLRAYDIKMRDSQAAFLKNDFKASQAFLDEANRLVPNQPETRNLQGALFYKAKRYEEALAIFKQLSADDPSSYPARFNVAEVLLMQKKFDDSYTAFSEILEDRPADEIVQLRLALILAYQGKLDSAREHAAKIPHPGQTAAYYYANAAIEYIVGNTSKGDDWIRQGETFFPPEASVDLRNVLIEHNLGKK